MKRWSGRKFKLYLIFADKRQMHVLSQLPVQRIDVYKLNESSEIGTGSLWKVLTFRHKTKTKILSRISPYQIH